MTDKPTADECISWINDRMWLFRDGATTEAIFTSILEQLRPTTAVQPEDVSLLKEAIIKLAVLEGGSPSSPTPFEVEQALNRILVAQTAHPIDGMTLPELPEGWSYSSISKHKNEPERLWFAIIIIDDDKNYQQVGDNGPTPRAAVLAAIAAIEGDKK